jgi:probable HAF family extracellular repeat protein
MPAHRETTATPSPARSISFTVVPLEVDGVMYGVNAHRALVGHELDATGATRAVCFSDGRAVPLGTLSGSSSSARGINDAGAIVGGGLTEGDETYHGFLYEDGKMHDLNSLIDATTGWEIVHALGINNRREIVALAQREGIERIVLLQPVDRDR